MRNIKKERISFKYSSRLLCLINHIGLYWLIWSIKYNECDFDHNFLHWIAVGNWYNTKNMYDFAQFVFEELFVNKCQDIYDIMNWSSPRRPLFLHALSFQCTTKLCINFLNQFSFCFHI